jgi:hypothetical protein
MKLPSVALRCIAASALICAAGSASAVITFTNSSASPVFVGGSVDRFTDLTINTFLPGLATSRSAGAFTYNVATTDVGGVESGLFVVPIAGNVGLSTAWFEDALQFTFTSPDILGFGGNFFRTNPLGEAVGANTGGATGAPTVSITVTDINGLSFTQAVNASLTTFSGFISDVPLASATVRIATLDPLRYISADNVVLSAVPEPGTYGLMALGLVSLLARRRRG